MLDDTRRIQRREQVRDAQAILCGPAGTGQQGFGEDKADHFVSGRESRLREGGESFASTEASYAARKNNGTRVASEHEASVGSFTNGLKAVADATQVLRSDPAGAD